MSERYKREIEDLLRQLDTRPLREPASARFSKKTARARFAVQHALRGFLRRAPSEQFMILSVALLLTSMILGLFPPLQSIVYWTRILALLFFLLGIGVALSQRKAGGESGRMWRGQVVDYRPRNPDLWWRIRQWFRRRR